MTTFCQTACLAEHFTVDPKAKSLRGLFSDRPLSKQFRLFLSPSHLNEMSDLWKSTVSLYNEQPSVLNLLSYAMPWVLRNPSWILGSRHLLYHESNHQTSQWFPFSPILCSHCFSQYNMTKVEDNRMHWYLLGKCMLNAIQFPCLMVCSITMFGRLYQFCTKLFNKVFFRCFQNHL